MTRGGADARMVAEAVTKMVAVAEEAKEEEENGRGCREERERFTVALGGRLVASCGGANGGKTGDEGGGG